MKRFGNRSKYDPIVEVVELLEANPTLARIRHTDGREDSVALRHLARFPRSDEPQGPAESTPPNTPLVLENADPAPLIETSPVDNTLNAENIESSLSNIELLPRRSNRIRKPVQRMDYK